MKEAISRLRPFFAWFVVAALGVGCCIAGGQLYRIDRVRCETWPPLAVSLPYAPVYLLGLAAISVAWLGIDRSVRRLPLPPPWQIGALGALLHVLALCALPFLSDDPLAYAAIGRALTMYHQSAATPLREALPPDDTIYVLIKQYDNWLRVGSQYGALFNQVCALIAALAGRSLVGLLRGFQAVALLATIGTAVLAGWAARHAPGPSSEERAAPAGTECERRQARALALVLFCPLALIEGTMNAHNDALLALGVAAFACCLVRRRTGLAWLPLVFVVLIKASGLLCLGLYAAYQAFRLASRILPERLVQRVHKHLILFACALAVLCTVACLVILAAAPSVIAASPSLGLLLGSPNDTYPYCIRSIECVPRAVLHFFFGWKLASWAVGILFRAAAGGLLLYMASRSQGGASHLAATAVYLLFYHLFLHGFSQPWYLLSLLPLLGFLDLRLQRVAIAFCISNLAYYSVSFVFNCERRPIVFLVKETLQTLIVLGPPLILLVRSRRPVQGAASAL